ncbi:MAG: hypothetical protein ACLFQM_07670 [Fidelibacterota bacterium]
MKKIFFIILSLLVVQVVFADITIKGDARVRPRLDQVFDAEGKTVEDFYYMYWARIWLDAQLTEGWYFSTKLASDGPGNFIGKFGDTPYDGNGGFTDGAATHSGGRGVVRFAEMHFGRKTDKMGYSMGILPMSALGNPEYDLHFYPMSKSDVPYLIVNTASAAGFRGYYNTEQGRLNVTLTVDDNTGNRLNDANPRDPYSLFADYKMKLGELDINPTLIFTSAGEDMAAPITAGANVGLPKVAGFSLSGGGYFTTQGVEAAGKYSGIMTHIKAARPLGPGTFVSWLDYKTIDTDWQDDNVNTALIWVMYKYVVYKSEIGSFYLAPTYRGIFQNTGNVEYIRNKFELTMHIDFK